MKTRTLLLLLANVPVLCRGGTPELSPAPAAPTAEPWLIPLIELRGRYEAADIDGFDTSHALTLRGRLGFKTMAWNGWSAVIEGEFSQSLINDYHGGAPQAHPFDPANSVIADPKTLELNQAFLQYQGFDTLARVGRQRLIFDNAAFIGNVGWRQNEQTFDAISLSNTSVGGLVLNYAYLNQINRIFGSQADAPLVAGPPPFDNVEDIAANVHLWNASYTGIEGFTPGAYIYLMDFRDKPNWDNRTFGVSAKADLLGLTFYGEFAWQGDAGFSADDEALYAHASATKVFAGHSLCLGVEHLDAGFKTPLATVHAFNGFADAFIGGRIEGTHHGLTDVYLSHTMPLACGIKWTNVLHAYGDNEFSAGYGWEYDSVLTKKFNEHFTGIAKFAHFESEGDAYVGGAALPTTSRVSVELNYTF